MTELINTLLLLGAGHGLFLAVILVTKRVNSTANRILAAAMVAFALYIFEGVYYSRGYYLAFPHLIGMSVPLVFLFGPIIYLYAAAVSSGAHGLRPRQWLHLTPAVVVFLYFLPYYLSSGEAKLAFMHELQAHGAPLDLTIAGHLQFVVGVAYVILTVRLLKRHRAQIKEEFSSIERINLLWLRNLTVATALIWALATGFYLVHLLGFGTQMEWDPTPLAVSCLVYGVGYMGLRQPEILHAPTARYPTPPPLPGVNAIPVAEQETGYEKSGLSAEEAEAAMQGLRRKMTESQLYLRSGLTLQELAAETGMSPHNLSEVINTRGGTNFYDFVNSYRVEEAMRRLRDPKYKHLTILAIAADAGFNSKSVFNAFFKEHTGQTPSQYRAAKEASSV